MKNIKTRAIGKYIKVAPMKIEKVSTTVYINRRHLDFIKRININLSHLVRDVIEALMNEELSGENSKGKKKGESND